MVVENQDSAQTGSSKQNVVPEDSSFSRDAEELLRIIRKSDYNVVDQLGQTPSKISIL